LSGHYKFEFTSERKDNFTSNAYELRMDCESAERAAVGFRDVFYVKFKTTKGKFFLGVVENEVMATSRKYSTELMVQKGLLK
jgi:hypothetical protein